ncbi:Trehalose import ATP-binding protein SugC [Posidoniimonas polymericola]|uniref:Trehalose import ATP-binding protein SugC n=1 Tax=Posidoniimonas polymericola TaxID=2528002 RepID=A0A5C5YFW7_9BACT|nr:ABC transporter ATP-binding protein [Posidoniimonas polymericola]TWT73829.1 Trehalose import ATP-binding protein SugC [Posidoniimonas polymericola]
MPTLELRHLSKTYPNGAAAVRDVSLQLPAGVLAVMVGPSGSGKSTLLRLIAGLERATSGEVLFDGTALSGVPPHRRDLAMLFQQPALYPYLSVRGNLAHGVKPLRLGRGEADHRVAEAARLLGLEPLLDRRPQELSGGEAQRVALGRALARRPRLLLLDEPLASLDAALRGELRGELRRLHAALGGTMLCVTHDQSEALALADLLVVINEGTLQQVGPPQELYERPANRFVAGFLGQPGMNLWSGRASDHRFEADGGAITAQIAGVPKGDMVLGVRAERLRLNDEQVPPLGRGRVTHVEPQGPDAVVHLDAGGARCAARSAAPCCFQVGDDVTLGAVADDLHWFAADAAGLRLA